MSLYISEKPNFKVHVVVKRMKKVRMATEQGFKEYEEEESVSEVVQFTNCVLYLSDNPEERGYDPPLKAAFDEALKNPHVSQFCRPITKDRESYELQMLTMQRGIVPQGHTGVATSDVFAEGAGARQEMLQAAQNAGVDPGATIVPGMTASQEAALGIGDPGTDPVLGGELPVPQETPAAEPKKAGSLVNKKKA